MDLDIFRGRRKKVLQKTHARPPTSNKSLIEYISVLSMRYPKPRPSNPLRNSTPCLQVSTKSFMRISCKRSNRTCRSWLTMSKSFGLSADTQSKGWS